MVGSGSSGPVTFTRPKKGNSKQKVESDLGKTRVSPRERLKTEGDPYWIRKQKFPAHTPPVVRNTLWRDAVAVDEPEEVRRT